MYIYTLIAAGVVVMTALDLAVKIWQLVSQVCPVYYVKFCKPVRLVMDLVRK